MDSLSPKESFRIYPKDVSSSISQHYYNMNTKQTLAFVKRKIQEYSDRPKISRTVKEVLRTLDNFVDPSDPDTTEGNSIHAYQTAERIRQDFPTEEWFQVLGLLHDLGKILFTFGEPSFCVVGDTFVVGCQYDPSSLYYEFFKDNPDFETYAQLNPPYGIYSPSCGLKNLNFSWGHDEYLYRVLLDNQDKHSFPPLAMAIIRYHSCYPLHTYDAYTYFLNKDDGDFETLRWLKIFSSYDLYSKKDPFVLTPEIETYYDNLLSKFFPQPLLW